MNEEEFKEELHKRAVRWGQIGAFESWARTTDRSARTAPARAAANAKFENAEDPDAARKAYFRRLAMRSAEVRSAKKRARLQAIREMEHKAAARRHGADPLGSQCRGRGDWGMTRNPKRDNPCE